MSLHLLQMLTRQVLLLLLLGICLSDCSRSCEVGTYYDIQAQSCRSCTRCGIGRYLDLEICNGRGYTDTGGSGSGFACELCKLPTSYPCPQGQYLDVQGCNKTADPVCRSCSACGPHEYLQHSVCDGRSRFDSGGFGDGSACKRCGQGSSCPAGEYHDLALCDGTQTLDVSVCRPCSACDTGQYLNLTICDGSGVQDSGRQGTGHACTTCTCEAKEGFYCDISACSGIAASGVLRPCSACAAGQYLDPTVCSGTSYSDAGGSGTGTACRPCKRADCNIWEYSFLPPNACDGTGVVNEAQCLPCSVPSGVCPVGQYINTTGCDGTGIDNGWKCSPCTIPQCDPGKYADVTSCTGKDVGVGVLRCRSCSWCSFGTFISSGCSGITDTTGCSDCTPCPAGTWQKVECRPLKPFDSECSPCKLKSCRSGWTTSHDQCTGSGSWDQAECVPCNCSTGQYILSGCGPGTLKTDVVCAACDRSPCPPGQYRSECDNQAHTDTGQCHDCGQACAVGEYIESGCDGTMVGNISDVTCQPCRCPQGQYI